jgi:CheY-like chemotaxis protein
MDNIQVYGILKEIASSMKARGESVKLLPDAMQPNETLDASGIDLMAFTDVVEDLKSRFRGKEFYLDSYMVPDQYYFLTVGKLVDQVAASFKSDKKDPVVVYVDDEEENLFIFKRKFGKRLNLKTFTDSQAALAFIQTNENVSLVITDEVMPNLGGNQLCDEVQKTKPLMKFILITGNPNQDDDLMYRTLRRNRFYEFFNKPIDLDGKGEEYFAVIQKALTSGL